MAERWTRIEVGAELPRVRDVQMVSLTDDRSGLHVILADNAGRAFHLRFGETFAYRNIDEGNRLRSLAAVSPSGEDVLCEVADSESRFSSFTVRIDVLTKVETPRTDADPRAQAHRAILRREASAGVNFAGAYRLVALRRGTRRSVLVIIDLRTGRCTSPLRMANGAQIRRGVTPCSRFNLGVGSFGLVVILDAHPSARTFSNGREHCSSPSRMTRVSRRRPPTRRCSLRHRPIRAGFCSPGSGRVSSCATLLRTSKMPSTSPSLSISTLRGRGAARPGNV